MAVLVRRAKSEDVSVITEYNRLMALETEGKVLDPLTLAAGVAAGLADEAKAVYFVAEENGEILGQLMLTREWSDWRNGWMWWIQSVYVRQASRRRGVFQALYRHVEEAAKRSPDVIGIRLYVEEDNNAAQKTYLHLGMKKTSYGVYERCPL